MASGRADPGRQHKERHQLANEKNPQPPGQQPADDRTEHGRCGLVVDRRRGRRRLCDSSGERRPVAVADRARPAAALVGSVALLAALVAVVLSAGVASAATAGSVCDEGDDPGESEATKKYARMSFVHGVDPDTGEPRRSSSFVHPKRLSAGETVAAYAYEDGADEETTKQAKVTGNVLEQVKRRAVSVWGDSVRIECSDTPFVVTGDEIMEAATVRIRVGISWHVDCQHSDFVPGQFKEPGPMADYDTQVACGGSKSSGGNYGNPVCVDPNTGASTPKAGRESCHPRSSGASGVAGASGTGKRGSFGGAGDIGAVGAPGSQPEPRPQPDSQPHEHRPGSQPGSQPEPATPQGTDPDVEPEPQPEPRSGVATEGGHQPEPQPPAPTTTVPARTAEQDHNDSHDTDGDGCLGQQEYIAAITSITTATSTNWSSMSQPDAVRDAHSRRC